MNAEFGLQSQLKFVSINSIEPMVHIKTVGVHITMDHTVSIPWQRYMRKCTRTLTGRLASEHNTTDSCKEFEAPLEIRVTGTPSLSSKFQFGRTN